MSGRRITNRKTYRPAAETLQRRVASVLYYSCTRAIALFFIHEKYRTRRSDVSCRPAEFGAKQQPQPLKYSRGCKQKRKTHKICLGHKRHDTIRLDINFQPSSLLIHLGVAASARGCTTRQKRGQVAVVGSPQPSTMRG